MAWHINRISQSILVKFRKKKKSIHGPQEKAQSAVTTPHEAPGYVGKTKDMERQKIEER
jgi:hypothetical protein